MRIVFCVEKLRTLPASCCIVLVVNGSGDFLPRSPFFTSSISKDSFLILSSITSFSSREAMLIFPFSSPVKCAVSGLFSPFAERSASIVQYSSGMNAAISSSRSHISLSATDWTRPAESPLLTFAHSTGDIS